MNPREPALHNNPCSSVLPIAAFCRKKQLASTETEMIARWQVNRIDLAAIGIPQIHMKTQDAKGHVDYSRCANTDVGHGFLDIWTLRSRSDVSSANKYVSSPLLYKKLLIKKPEQIRSKVSTLYCYPDVRPVEFSKLRTG